MRALIVAPTSVVTNWERELARFSPSFSVALWHGADRKDQIDSIRGNTNPLIRVYLASWGYVQKSWLEGTPAVPEFGGENAGLYTSLTFGADGRPGIAYLALIEDTGGAVRSEVRFVMGRVPNPTSVADWELLPVIDGGPVQLPPETGPIDVHDAIGLFVSSARFSDGRPIIAYYDRPNGDLKVATYDAAANAFLAPEIIDGAWGADVGWYPSITVGDGDSVHLSYVDAGRDNLVYINLTDRIPEIVDDGYRQEGTTADGLPKPVFHFVGDDSAVISKGALLAVVYQDATTHELLLAVRTSDGGWNKFQIAGNEDPFAGAYGFYAAAEYNDEDIVMSTYVVHAGEYDQWVEVFRQPAIAGKQ